MSKATTDAVPTADAPTGRARWVFPLVVAVCALALFAGLSAYLRSVERSVVGAGALSSQLDRDGSLRPLASVRSAVRAMKLVTVEIDTTVTAQAEDESWRGDVSATLKAPARLYYGTDLSGVADSAVSFSPVLSEYVVRVGRPMRIATEVFAEESRPEVQTGWLRLRSRAGEYYLGLARKDLTDRGRAMALSPEESEKVESATREQIAGLVRAIAGRDARVVVVFEEQATAKAVGPGGGQP